MNLAEFMEVHFADDDDPPETVEVKGEQKLLGPAAGICWPHNSAASCDVATDDDTKEAKDEKDDDDLDFSFEMDSDDMETLKEVYVFLDDLITWVLAYDVDMPKDIAKRLQMAAGDTHFLINQFEVWKPENAGYTDLVTTLEDMAKVTK